MKLKTTTMLFLVAMGIVALRPEASDADANRDVEEMHEITSFLYHAGSGDSRQTSRALALYGAKFKAVLLSAEHLAGRGLLKEYGARQMEVFCLVVDRLQYSMLDDWFSEKDRIAEVKIKSSVSLNDFVKSEIRNSEFDKQEANFTFQEEMEPVVSPTIAPAQELSRAYRYIRKHHWRMAIIYLDHLEKKYPHWGALFTAKSIAYLGMHETERAISALSSACYLGDQDACLKLNELDPPN